MKRERKLKQIYVSANMIVEYGKSFFKELQKQLPQNTVTLWTQENIDTGCLHVLLYNPDWDTLEPKEIVPELEGFEMKSKEESRIQLIN